MNNHYEHVTYDPEILNGKPIIKGTRLSVEFIMELIASGSTTQEIAKQYPHVPLEAIQEAVLYAAASLKNEIYISVKVTA